MSREPFDVPREPCDGRPSDEALGRAARELRRPLPGPDPADRLWERIEASLDAPARPAWPAWPAWIGARVGRRGPGARVLVPAALAAAGLVLAAWLAAGTPDAPAALLARTEAALLGEETATLERELARLEASLPSGEAREPLLSAQIARLDANLAQCRAATARNPLNRSVRRSLLDSSRRKAALLRSLLSETSTDEEP